jgi:hypothetical protein
VSFFEEDDRPSRPVRRLDDATVSPQRLRRRLEHCCAGIEGAVDETVEGSQLGHDK